MSWELKAYGHITVPHDAPPDAVAEIEADLAVRIGALLSEYKYGCSNSAFSGTYVTGDHEGAVVRKPAEPAVHRMGERDQQAG